jgi:hypothetical protein
LHQHAEDVFGEPAFGDAAVADGVDADAEPLGVPAGGRAVKMSRGLSSPSAATARMANELSSPNACAIALSPLSKIVPAL